jgi:penicillin amidase
MRAHFLNRSRLTVARTARLAGIAGGIVAALLVVAVLIVWLGLRMSLPTIDGTAAMPQLHGRVTIERDAAGVPTLTGTDREDLARALGFAHGQDRFFQMDLMRRAAAGELSALLGPALLETDRQLRPHRLRSVARAVVAALAPGERALLDAYVAGVNAGLRSLGSRPFEYWLLNGRPRAWSAEDSILCVHAMYLQLQDARGAAELQRGFLRAALPPAAWRFLEAGAPEWDAAVDGTRSDEPRVPLPEEYNLRRSSDLPTMPPDALKRRLSMLGSNNWAVAGTKTANGAAMVANDMHLGYRVPNTWYRARVIQHGGRGALDVTGVTLPGTPSIIAGSNGSIAWGFTNSYGEFATVVRLVPVAGDPMAYATAAGPHEIVTVDEPIEVAGGRVEHLPVELTEWGPILGRDWLGHPYALQWTAQNPEATNLNLIELEHAGSVEEALRQAPGFGMPGQNLLVADKAGHIGWTIAGRLPQRAAPQPGLPQESTDPVIGYSGWLAAADQPRVANPAEGFLWSANARVIGGSGALLIGDDGMDRGARAQQIRADLEASSLPFTPARSLAIQLDARAVFLERWKDLLHDVITQSQAAGSHEHDAALAALGTWSGRAAPEDAAYRLVHLFREQVAARVFFMLVAPARVRNPGFEMTIPASFEGPLWRLLAERPMHLLASTYASWDELLLAALSASEKLPPGCAALASCTWGHVNPVHVAHPLSAALPWLAPLLDMPTVEVPGGREDMPHIQGRTFGASERFSVSPGDEAHGYFHMPGAQSGHPLSPFYRKGFDDWVNGRPTPFLPGPTVHTLVLSP